MRRKAAFFLATGTKIFLKTSCYSISIYHYLTCCIISDKHPLSSPMAVQLNTLLKQTQVLHPNEIEDKTCPVCLEDYLKDDSREFPRKLPCGHFIGTECLLTWASSRAHAASIDCPWCTRPIVHSTAERRLKEAVIAYARVVFLRYVERVHRVHGILDRLHWSMLVFTGVVSVMGCRYFESCVAWFPFECLRAHARVAIEDRLKPRPRFGIGLMVLGFCIGTFLDRDLGRSMIDCGQAPFEGAVTRAYGDRALVVLGLSLVVLAGVAIQGSWEYRASQMIILEALKHFVCCLVYQGLRIFGIRLI